MMEILGGMYVQGEATLLIGVGCGREYAMLATCFDISKKGSCSRCMAGTVVVPSIDLIGP